MGMKSWFKRIIGKSAYPGREVSATYVRERLEAKFKPRYMSIRDRKFWLMSRADTEALIHHAWEGLPYYAADLADCDDFAITCQADIIRYAISKNLPLQPPIGRVKTFWKEGGGHEFQWLMSEEADDFFEPQDRSFYVELWEAENKVGRNLKEIYFYAP